jgi:hypothetical protein
VLNGPICIATRSNCAVVGSGKRLSGVRCLLGVQHGGETVPHDINIDLAARIFGVPRICAFAKTLLL